MTVAIRVDQVSKRFRIRHHEKTLKERFAGLLGKNKKTSNDFWALQDISLEIKKGETFGLLGANGSGKSTLLKCIAGILPPNSGTITSVGRLAALLELGAGFHPDLTGRENIYLNASILGIPKTEIERRFDAIVAFSELEQFIDNQVKHYSSGMYMRLGFSVAINVIPDILLIDEVLAVGDEAFQQKCLDRIQQFQQDGRTIIFVTHSTDLVRQICNRATVLHHGRQILTGSPDKAIATYRELVHATPDTEHTAPPSTYKKKNKPQKNSANSAENSGQEQEGSEQERKPARIVNLSIAHTPHKSQNNIRNNAQGNTEKSIQDTQANTQDKFFVSGQFMSVAVSLQNTQEAHNLIVAINIKNQNNQLLFATDTETLGARPLATQPLHQVIFEFESMPFVGGEYTVTATLRGKNKNSFFQEKEHKERFRVNNPDMSAGLVHLDTKAVLVQSCPVFQTD